MSGEGVRRGIEDAGRFTVICSTPATPAERQTMVLLHEIICLLGQILTRLEGAA